MKPNDIAALGKGISDYLGTAARPGRILIFQSNALKDRLADPEHEVNLEDLTLPLLSGVVFRAEFIAYVSPSNKIQVLKNAAGSLTDDIPLPAGFTQVIPLRELMKQTVWSPAEPSPAESDELAAYRALGTLDEIKACFTRLEQILKEREASKAYPDVCPAGGQHERVGMIYSAYCKKCNGDLK